MQPLSSEEYQKRGNHCRRLAEQAPDPSQRELLMATAQRWYDLAEQASLGECTLPCARRH